MPNLHAALSTRYPHSHAVLNHVLDGMTPFGAASVREAYGKMDAPFFEDLEGGIARVIAISGADLAHCLADLDAFNALTPEIENDAWYEQPRAFTSMHLDALLLGFARRRLEATCRQVAAFATPATRVLEIGCGSGRLSELLVGARPDLELTLMDRSAAAIDFVRRLHGPTAAGSRVSCQRGELADIPVPDATFDGVVAAEVFEHAPDPGKSAAEILRVLRPGGWLAISVPIDLDIAMHPVVFRDAQDILGFFGARALELCASEIVRPVANVDAIVTVFPDFQGCLNAVFRKRHGVRTGV